MSYFTPVLHGKNTLMVQVSVHSRNNTKFIGSGH